MHALKLFAALHLGVANGYLRCSVMALLRVAKLLDVIDFNRAFFYIDKSKSDFDDQVATLNICYPSRGKATQKHLELK